MSNMNRRKLLKLVGGGAVLGKTGGLAGILASARAPAYAQTTTVHWLRWNDFVPAADQTLRDLLPEAEKALGIKVNFERVGLNDLQARLTSAIQSGAGADIVMLFNNHPHLYAASSVDLSDLAEAVGKEQGGYYPSAKGNCYDGKRWIGLPTCIIGVMNAYRKSWFDEVGATKFPETWTSIVRSARSSRRRGGRLGSRSVSRSAIL